MKVPVVFDVDEVLARFREGYERLARKIDSAIPVPEDHDTAPWDAYLDRRVWNAIKASHTFWTELPALVSLPTFRRIHRLGLERDVYFATSRPGTDTRRQTRVWLEMHGVFSPSVIVTSRKGEFCRVVNAGYMLEDKPGTAVYTAYQVPETASCLLDWPWNRFDQTVLGSKVRRVQSVEEFLDLVEAEGR